MNRRLVAEVSIRSRPGVQLRSDVCQLYDFREGWNLESVRGVIYRSSAIFGPSFRCCFLWGGVLVIGPRLGWNDVGFE